MRKEKRRGERGQDDEKERGEVQGEEVRVAGTAEGKEERGPACCMCFLLL